MKIRTGFVSNSSSASFTIALRYLSGYQLEAILNHHENCNSGDAWELELTEHTLSGHTWMDNYDLEGFMETLGVDLTKINWTYRG